MSFNNGHSLCALSISRARTRALYMLFVAAVSFLVLTAAALFTPSAYADEPLTGANNQVSTCSVQSFGSADEGFYAQEDDPGVFDPDPVYESAPSNSGSSAQQSAGQSANRSSKGVRTVTFDVDGQISSTQVTADCVTINRLDDKVVDGFAYYFVGWETPDGTVLEPDREYELNSDITLKAKWRVVALANSQVTAGANGDQSNNMGVAGDSTNTSDIDAILGQGVDGIGTSAAAGPVKNYFHPVYKYLYWSWDASTGTLTVGNEGTTSGEVDIGTYTGSTLPWLVAATGGVTSSQIKNIVFKENAYHGKISAKSFAGWFKDYTALVSFDVTGLGVGMTTDFSSMFEGCQNLTTFTGLGNWKTNNGMNYSNMFSGCISLETLDISGFYTADYTGVTKNRTNMLGGMTSLKSIRVSSYTALADTGIEAIISKKDSQGIWEAQDQDPDEEKKWKGNASALIDRYGTTGGTLDSGAEISVGITYVFHPCGVFTTNSLVHWDYNTTTSVLTIFADKNINSSNIEVSDATMPWLLTVPASKIKSVVFSTIDLDGAGVSKVMFKNMKDLFKDYVNLATFDGRGLITVGTNNFENLFAGCTSLTSIDMTGWEMRNQAATGQLRINGMLEGCTKLAVLRLSDGVVLFVSDANNAGLHGVHGLGKDDGVWERTDAMPTDPWFGTSHNLEARYDKDGTGVDHGSAIYTFTTAYRGGRFENDNTWWKYTISSNLKTLTIGADALEPGETGNFKIEKLTKDQVPWIEVVNNKAIVDITQITNIVMTGNVAPVFMAQWFMGYSSLLIFNGQNMDSQYCTDFSELFMGDANLATINIASWDTMRVGDAQRQDMFAGCVKLSTLTIGKGVNLVNTGIEGLDKHTADDGTWVRQESNTDSWKGSSQDFIDRYNGPASEGSTMLGDDPAIYLFDTSLLVNVFKSNSNVWWQFDKTEQMLTIGVSNTALNSDVTETFDDLPWLTVLGGATDAEKQEARELVAHVYFTGKVYVLNPMMWFNGYTNLQSAYVSDMAVSKATSLASVFAGCTKLETLNGLSSWDVSKATNLSHAFDGCIFTDAGDLSTWKDKVGSVTDLSYIFANNPNVTTLSSLKDWQLMSAVNFSHAFENCLKLVTLDISGWDMSRATSTTNRENMLFSTEKLGSLTLSDRTNLADTGLGLSTSATNTRDSYSGTWEASIVTRTQAGTTAEHAWFGTSADLVRRYSKALGLGDDIVYTWRNGVYGGRIEQPGDNYDELWWKFVKGTDDATGSNTGTLTMGTDNPNGTNLTLTPATAPWVDVIWHIYGDADQQAGLSHVTNFVAQKGTKMPANLFLSADSLTGLFDAAQGYTGLTKFDGAGFDTHNVTSFANMFKTVSTLEQVTGVDKWITVSVTDMSFMFAGTTKLKGITSLAPVAGTEIWDVSNVTNFSSMFAGCAALSDATGPAAWAVKAGSNLASMFQNASGVSSLDISGWDMTGGSDVTNMLAGMTGLNRIGLGTKSVLEGTGFETIVTRLMNLGSWDRVNSDWFGNTKNLVALYPNAVDANGFTNTIVANGGTLGDPVYYAWANGMLRGRFRNDNAYWMITWRNSAHTSAALTIGIDNTAGNREVDETWEETPWTEVLAPAGAAAGDRSGNNLITFITMERGITPLNFEKWFADYANLDSFNGRPDGDVGVDVSKTTSLAGLFMNDRKLNIIGNISDWEVKQVRSFDEMFKNCVKLRVMDIHNWVMGPNATTTHVDMLRGLDALTTIILNGTVSLRDSGLDITTSSSLHATDKGSWLRIMDGTSVAYPDDPWFGSSANLVTRYDEETNIHGCGAGEGAIYTWTNLVRGRFDNNDNAWWSYDANRKILTMGIDDPEDGEVFEVDDCEVSATAGDLPWERAYPAIKKNVLQIYAEITGAYVLRPTSMEGWFKDYTVLKMFDGSKFDTSLLTSATASLDNLFNGCVALETLNLKDWNWFDGASHTDMLKNLKALKSITLDRGAALDGTGLDAIDTRVASAGRWIMDKPTSGAVADDIPWFDSSAKLVLRYSGDEIGSVIAKQADGTWKVLENLRGTHTYTWDDTILGGRFEENPNAWWIFYKEAFDDIAAGTLVLGSDSQDLAGSFGLGVNVTVHGTASASTGADGKITYSYDGSAMPWTPALPDLKKVLHVRTSSTSVLRPANMLAWFANMTELISFDGSGLDMHTVTVGDSFQGMFFGDAKLQDVDIRNWDMASHVGTDDEVRDMFTGCASLLHLTVGKRTVLKGTGINVDMVKHTQRDGSWIHDRWFGSGDELASLFVKDEGATVDGLKEFGTGVEWVTFTWDIGNLCGRFTSNNNVWWRYTGVADEDDNYLHVGLLRIGSDSKNIAESYVTEFGDDLPWRKLLDNVNVITEVITGADMSGSVLVASLENWFGHNTLNGVNQYHTGLTTFDGSGLVLNSAAGVCTSVAGLFDSADHLNVIKGLNTWDTVMVTDFTRAFYDTKRIAQIDLRSWVMTQVNDASMVENMFTGMGSLTVGTGNNTTTQLQAITLGPNAVLEGTGLGTYVDVKGNVVVFKGDKQGCWVMGDPLNLDPTIANTDVAWHGTNKNFNDRYKIGSADFMAGSCQQDKRSLLYIHTYLWNNEYIGGHFDSNQNVFWTYTLANKELVIGVFNKNATVEYADDWTTVTYRKDTVGWAHRTTEIGPQTPWQKLGLAVNVFRADGTQGKVAPATLDSWFSVHAAVDGIATDRLDLANMDPMGTGATSAWETTGNIGVVQEIDRSFTMSVTPDGATEYRLAPVYLTTGVTYRMNITWRNYKWGGSSGDAGWQVLPQDYANNLTSPIANIKFNSSRTSWYNTYTTFTVPTSGTYYVGFNGQGLQNSTYKYGVKDFSITIPSSATMKTFDGTNIDAFHIASLKDTFNGQSALQRVSGVNAWNTVNLVNMAGAFQDCSALTGITSMTLWDVSKVTDFSYAFKNVRNFDVTLNLAWKTPNAVNFAHMFEGCASVPNTNYLARWDVTNVLDFSYMFAGCTGMTNADGLGRWQVAIQATVDAPYKLTGMFMGATRLNFVDFTEWKMYDRDANGGAGEIYVDTTNMLANAGSLQQIVMGIKGLLQNSGFGLDTIDMVDPGTGNVIKGKHLNSLSAAAGGWTRYGSNVAWFGPTDALVSIYTPGSEFEAPENLIYTYVWRVEQTGGHVFPSNRFAWWKFMPDSHTLVIGVNDNTNNDDDYKTFVTEKWYELPWLVDISGDNDHVYKRSDIWYIEFVGDLFVINPEYWFAGLNNLVSADLSHMKIDLADSVEGLFGTLPGNDAIPEDATDAMKAANNPGQACGKLVSVTGLQNWNNTMNVGPAAGDVYGQPIVDTTSLKGMFQGAASLTDLEFVQGWNLNTITDLSFMFDGCSSLKDVSQLATWDTSNVLTMEGMFRNVSKLKVVDGVLTWDTRKVQNFCDMFNGASSVVDIDFSGEKWLLTGAVLPDGSYNITNMLANLDALKTITLPLGFTLTGSGLEISKTHKSTDGTWEQEAFRPTGGGASYVAWWGNATKLVERYPAGDKKWIYPAYQDVWDVAQYLTYTFKTSYLGGRFESNHYAWWKYDKKGTLIMSVDTTIQNGKPQTETRVWEDVFADDDTLSVIDWYDVATGAAAAPTGIYNAPSIPWLGIVPTEEITKIIMQNGFAPVNPNGWFGLQDGVQNYSGLVEFDGSRADMTRAVSFANMFEDCRALKRVSTGALGWNDLPVCTSMARMFAGCSSLEEVVGIDRWDVTHVIDFSGMFSMDSHGTAAGVLDDNFLVLIGKWHIGENVAPGTPILMTDMFKDLRSITTLDGLANWDVSKVTDMSFAFANMKNLVNLTGLANWKTTSTKTNKLNMTNMLSGCTALVNASALRDWVVDAAIMTNLFYDDTALTTVEIDRWNMQEAEITNLFFNNTSLGDLAKNGYVRMGATSKLTGTALPSISTRTARLGSWVRDGADPIAWFGTGNAFVELYKDGLTGIGNLINTPAYLDYRWDNTFLSGRFPSNPHAWWMYFLTDRTYDGDEMKEGMLLLGADSSAANKVVTETYDILPWLDDPSTSEVDPLVDAIQVKYVRTKYGIAPKYPAEWFKNYTSIIDFEGSGMDITADVTSLKGMFATDDTSEEKSSLEAFTGVDNWNVSNVTTLADMFRNASKLTTIQGFTGWASKTGKVNTMASMFYNNAALIGDDLTEFLNWNVTNVADMSNLFNGCTSIENVDHLYDWRPAKVTNLDGAFMGMTSLTSIEGLRDWNPGSDASVRQINMANLLNGCVKLTSLVPITGSREDTTAPHWNVVKTTDFSNMFKNIASASNEMSCTSIDLSQWDMRSNTYRQGNLVLTDMLRIVSDGAGKTNFQKYVFGPNTVLWVSENNNAGMDLATLLTASDGVWIKNTNALGLATSVGNSTNLMQRYPLTGAAAPTEVTTYTWDPTHRGA